MENEIFKLELPQKLLNHIEEVDGKIKEQINNYATELNKRGHEIITNLIQGFLTDKDTPDTEGVQLKGKYLV